MSVSVKLPDDLASRLAEEAGRRHMTPDELAATVLSEHIPKSGHRLSFAAVGASTSGRNAVDDEEMLAEGFGR
jgi:predicted transcriptional regulator